jgi:archaellum biogenesis protein FlaJ (TadC family)
LGIKTAKTVKVSRESALSILLLAPSLLFAIYYLLAGKMLEAVLVLPVGMGILLVLRYMARRNLPKKVDFALTTAIFHMYGLSLGETSPEDLVETIAENREYGFYSRIFQKIRSLAKDFGYGITKATAHVAEAVKPPLKDILVRLTNVFSSIEPRGYLEMESSMLIEEYSGYYTRAH